LSRGASATFRIYSHMTMLSFDPFLTPLMTMLSFGVALI
jgi:hypothetical protein